MVPNTSSAAALVLLPLILAASFNSYLSTQAPSALPRAGPPFNGAFINGQQQNGASRQQQPQQQQQQQQPAQMTRIATPTGVQSSPGSPGASALPPIFRVGQNLVTPVNGARPQLPTASVGGNLNPTGRFVGAGSGRQTAGGIERVDMSNRRANDKEENRPQPQLVNRANDHKEQLQANPMTNDPFSLAKQILENVSKKDIRSMQPSDGLNVNNHNTMLKIGNNKNVNVHSFRHNFNPLDKMGANGFPSPFGMNGNRENGPKGDDERGFFGDGGGGGGMVDEAPKKETKQKATSEQKELKRKLIKLAEKATSTPTNVLRYNEETQQLEPVEQDPAKELYKQKLQGAIKALSAKKLNPERLKEALEGFDEEPEEQAAGNENQNENPEVPDEHSWNRMPEHYGRMQEEHGGEPEHESQWRPEQVAHWEPSREMGEDLNDNHGDGGFHYQDPEPYQNQGFYDHDPYQQYQEEQQQQQEPDLGDTEIRAEPSRSRRPYSIARNGHTITPSYINMGPEMVDRDDVYDDDVNQDMVDDNMGELVRDMRERLTDRWSRLSDLLVFKTEILNQLVQVDDRYLNPILAEFKRMILCNSDERFCNRDLTSCPPTDDELRTFREADYEDNRQGKEGYGYAPNSAMNYRRHQDDTDNRYPQSSYGREKEEEVDEAERVEHPSNYNNFYDDDDDASHHYSPHSYSPTPVYNKPQQSGSGFGSPISTGHTDAYTASRPRPFYGFNNNKQEPEFPKHEPTSRESEPLAYESSRTGTMNNDGSAVVNKQYPYARPPTSYGQHQQQQQPEQGQQPARVPSTRTDSRPTTPVMTNSYYNNDPASRRAPFGDQRVEPATTGGSPASYKNQQEPPNSGPGLGSTLSNLNKPMATVPTPVRPANLVSLLRNIQSPSMQPAAQPHTTTPQQGPGPIRQPVATKPQGESVFNRVRPGTAPPVMDSFSNQKGSPIQRPFDFSYEKFVPQGRFPQQQQQQQQQRQQQQLPQIAKFGAARPARL